MSLKCYYHPEREASTKCERCGKVICLECKMVFRVRHSSGTGNHRRVYSSSYDYCPECFYDRSIQNMGRAKIGAIIFTTFGLVILFFVLFMWGELFGLFFLIVIIPPVIYAFVYGPRKVKELKLQKAEFLNNLRDTQILTEEKTTKLFCSECGHKLEPGVSVCSYCGTVLKV